MMSERGPALGETEPQEPITSQQDDTPVANEPSTGSAQDRFLRCLPATRCSLALKIVLDSVEGVFPTPEQVATLVSRDALRHQDLWRENDGRRALAASILSVLRDKPDLSLAFFQELLDYKALTPAERERLKLSRRSPYVRASMVGKPVTDAQRRFLAALGYRGPEPEDRAAAGDLLELGKQYLERAR
jgi:hypothetical protein